MAPLNPRAPAAAEMLLRSKPFRNSEQTPDGQKQSHMASQSQWLPGKSLKTARTLAKGLEFCRRVNSGAGVLVTFSFCSQLACAWAQERTYGSAELQYITFSPENKCWPVSVKIYPNQVEQYRFSRLKKQSSGFQILITRLLPTSKKLSGG